MTEPNQEYEKLTEAIQETRKYTEHHGLFNIPSASTSAESWPGLRRALLLNGVLAFEENMQHGTNFNFGEYLKFMPTEHRDELAAHVQAKKPLTPAQIGDMLMWNAGTNLIKQLQAGVSDGPRNATIVSHHGELSTHVQAMDETQIRIISLSEIKEMVEGQPLKWMSDLEMILETLGFDYKQTHYFKKKMMPGVLGHENSIDIPLTYGGIYQTTIPSVIALIYAIAYLFQACDECQAVVYGDHVYYTAVGYNAVAGEDLFTASQALRFTKKLSKTSVQETFGPTVLKKNNIDGCLVAVPDLEQACALVDNMANEKEMPIHEVSAVIAQIAYAANMANIPTARLVSLNRTLRTTCNVSDSPYTYPSLAHPELARQGNLAPYFIITTVLESDDFKKPRTELRRLVEHADIMLGMFVARLHFAKRERQSADQIIKATTTAWTANNAYHSQFNFPTMGGWGWDEGT